MKKIFKKIVEVNAKIELSPKTSGNAGDLSFLRANIAVSS
jgi:hypothetical protein